MPRRHAHYDVQDAAYYCDLCQAADQPEGGEASSFFDSYEACKHHLKTVHGKNRFLIEGADRDPRTREEPQRRRRERPPTPSVSEVLALPDWEPDGVIHNRLRVEKSVEEQRRAYTLKVTLDGEGLKGEVLPRNVSLPPNTCMSERVLTDPPADQPLASIYGALRELQSSFLYFSKPMEYDIVTLASVASYFREVFNTYPFIGFVSNARGTGKTTATMTAAFASYNGIWLAIPSAPSFFRLVEDAHGVVGIDQVDDIFAHPRDNMGLLALIDGAHRKGIVVPRCERLANDQQVVRFYEPFCIVVFNGTEAIPASLLSRSIIVTMTECAGRKRLRKDPLPLDFLTLRDALYVWRLRHSDDVQRVYDELKQQSILVDRNADVFLPLLTVAKVVDNDRLYADLLAFAEQYYQQQHAKRLDIWQQALVELLSDFRGPTTVVAIRDALTTRLVKLGELRTDRDGEPKKPVGSRWVSNQLDKLGFQRATREPMVGRARYMITEERVTELQFIYSDVLGHTPQNASLSSLSSLEARHVINGTATDTPQTTQQAVLRSAPEQPPNSEDSEAISGYTQAAQTHETQIELPTTRGTIPEQPVRLGQLLKLVRFMARKTPRGQVEEVYLLGRCQRHWSRMYDHVQLDADLAMLDAAGKISRPRPGIVGLVHVAFGPGCTEVGTVERGGQ